MRAIYICPFIGVDDDGKVVVVLVVVMMMMVVMVLVGWLVGCGDANFYILMCSLFVCPT